MGVTVDRDELVRRIRAKIQACENLDEQRVINTPEKALEWVLRELLNTTP